MGLPPLLLRAGRKLCSPSQHIWIRARDTFVCSKGNKSHVLDLGLTRRGVEDIGDVQSIVLVKPEVRQGDDLLRVNWEGHNITAADELYHTMWETVEESITIKSPITGTVQETDIDNPWIDSDDYLLSIEASEHSVFSAFSTLVDEESYDKIVRKLPPGRFEESIMEAAVA